MNQARHADGRKSVRLSIYLLWTNVQASDGDHLPGWQHPRRRTVEHSERLLQGRNERQVIGE